MEQLSIISAEFYVFLTGLVSYRCQQSVDHRPVTDLYSNMLIYRGPWTSCLHLTLSCAAASIFLLLYVKFAVYVSFSRFLYQMFLDRLFLCTLVLSAEVAA